MISLSSLPEELLDVILCFTLSLPSSSFLEWMDEDTYSCTPASPTRTVLLVNKTWARIGKPHLYEGVIIRGREQADALAETLNANTKAHAGVNITLAKCIRRLRIDGVQTSAVKDILWAATNVQALFLNVGVPVNKPPPIDWFGAFKRMSPQLVYIQDEGEDYKSKRLLLEAVEDVLAPVPGQSSNSARWGRVREVYHYRSRMRVGRTKRSTTGRCLDGGVKAIEITRDGKVDIMRFNAPVPKPARREYRMEARVLPATGRDLPNSVWSHILSYAILKHGLGEGSEIDIDRSLRWPAKPSGSGKSALLLVSKRFKEMAEPLLYASPHLYSDRSIKLFGQTLSKRPELAQRVRVLLMPSTSVTRRYEHAVPTLRGLRIIPWALPNLRASNGALFASISPGKELRLLRPPSSLVSLRLTCLTCSSVQNGDKQVLDGDFIHSLPRLERLHLCGCIVGKPHVAPPADALPLLRTLHLEQGKGMNPAFQWLSGMQLPAFDSYVLSMYNPTTWEQPHESDAAVDSLPRFLIKHGHKFTSIKIGGERNPLEWKIPLLDLCPNVEMLEISSTCRPGPTSEEHHPWRSMPLQPEMLRCTRPHRHLELLAITASDVFDTSFQSKHPNRGSREWEKLLLDEIHLTPFVALEELELPYNVYWPESDTSAKENPWPGMIAILKQRNPMMTITRGGMMWARAVTQQTEE